MADYQGEKFRLFLKKKDLGVTEASKMMGISRQAIYLFFKTTSLQRDTVNKILDTFKVKEEDIWNDKESPRLEAIPLRLADPYGLDATNEKTYILPDDSLIMQVPIITQRAYAGYLVGFSDPEFYDDLDTIPLPVEKKHGGYYLAFEVKGDSMVSTDPEIMRDNVYEGWIAIGRDIPKDKWKYKLHTHTTDTWIIVHKEKGILIKQIANQDVDQGIITIHSLNPQYSDEEFKLSDIEQIFSVVQIINKKR